VDILEQIIGVAAALIATVTFAVMIWAGQASAS
jgi:hypothetical protein